MKLHFLILAAGLAAAAAHAQPVKCVDEKGRVRYVDAAMAAQQKCKPVKGEVQTVTPQQGAAIKPPPPPKPDPAGTPEERREALKRAEQRLAGARKALADQEAIREGGERNYARVEERLQPYRDDVQRAEQNLEDARKALR